MSNVLVSKEQIERNAYLEKYLLTHPQEEEDDDGDE